jgi:hypothetical protein
MPRTFLCGHCGRPVTPSEVAVHYRLHYNPRPYVLVGSDYVFLARDWVEENGKITTEFSNPQPPRHLLEAARKKAPGQYPVSEAIRAWLVRHAPSWEK